MKTGLVLEGGAMRGLFTAGVIDVMMENGIEFDGGIGVSAGAAFGCNYKSKQIGRPFRYNTAYARDPRYCSVRSLLFTGDLYGAKFCYDTLPNKLDRMDVETYLANPMKFYVVVTDVETGEPFYYDLQGLDEKDMAYMRASASMPIVSRAVEIDGHSYLDGGISDSIPLKKFEEMGYERNVLILTRPAGYRKTPTPQIMDRLLKKYPAVAETLKNRHIVYNQTLDYIEERKQAGAAYVICPPQPLKIGKIEHNPEVMRNVYYQGRREAQKHIPAVREFLRRAKEEV
ncbi:MAG: patatin family protein [Erysipelotrichaceae bacterium]|nr:patatin family protein [Erysipelotrichaceae bacterium]